MLPCLALSSSHDRIRLFENGSRCHLSWWRWWAVLPPPLANAECACMLRLLSQWSVGRPSVGGGVRTPLHRNQSEPMQNHANDLCPSWSSVDQFAQDAPSVHRLQRIVKTKKKMVKPFHSRSYWWRLFRHHHKGLPCLGNGMKVLENQIHGKFPWIVIPSLSKANTVKFPTQTDVCFPLVNPLITTGRISVLPAMTGNENGHKLCLFFGA